MNLAKRGIRYLCFSDRLYLFNVNAVQGASWLTIANERDFETCACIVSFCERQGCRLCSSLDKQHSVCDMVAAMKALFSRVGYVRSIRAVLLEACKSTIHVSTVTLEYALECLSDA